jgi:heme oxygenase (biliverdin-IX-beta and delta-forming)
LVTAARPRAPRHAYLREATAAIHAEVERAVDAAGYFADVGRYGVYLRRLHLFHGQLAAAERVVGDASRAYWRVDEHLAWLTQDLAALGLAPFGAPLPRVRGPNLRDPTASLGALYVVVGSALGSRILVKQARAILPAAAGGDRYLSALAETTDWPGFLGVLERAEISSEARLGQGAIAAFESVLDAFTVRIPA